MEINMKERILQEALDLFSQNGYIATSMSDIAKKLNVSKAALYKHYTSKQEIFDRIVERMNQMDQDRIVEYQMPEGKIAKIAKDYSNTPLEKIVAYSEAMYRHWTQEEFSCKFRKILTLEQYRCEELGSLYQQYLSNGPVNYMAELFDEMIKEENLIQTNAKQMALDFYGPIYLLISMYDGEKDKEKLILLLKDHIDHFAKQQGLVRN